MSFHSEEEERCQIGYEKTQRVVARAIWNLIDRFDGGETELGSKTNTEKAPPLVV